MTGVIFLPAHIILYFPPSDKEPTNPSQNPEAAAKGPTLLLLLLSRTQIPSPFADPPMQTYAGADVVVMMASEQQPQLQPQPQPQPREEEREYRPRRRFSASHIPPARVVECRPVRWGSSESCCGMSVSSGLTATTAGTAPFDLADASASVTADSLAAAGGIRAETGRRVGARRRRKSLPGGTSAPPMPSSSSRHCAAAAPSRAAALPSLSPRTRPRFARRRSLTSLPSTGGEDEDGSAPPPPAGPYGGRRPSAAPSPPSLHRGRRGSLASLASGPRQQPHPQPHPQQQPQPQHEPQHRRRMQRRASLSSLCRQTGPTTTTTTVASSASSGLATLGSAPDYDDGLTHLPLPRQRPSARRQARRLSMDLPVLGGAAAAAAAAAPQPIQSAPLLAHRQRLNVLSSSALSSSFASGEGSPLEGAAVGGGGGGAGLQAQVSTLRASLYSLSSDLEGRAGGRAEDGGEAAAAAAAAAAAEEAQGWVEARLRHRAELAEARLRAAVTEVGDLRVLNRALLRREERKGGGGGLYLLDREGMPGGGPTSRPPPPPRRCARRGGRGAQQRRELRATPFRVRRRPRRRRRRRLVPVVLVPLGRARSHPLLLGGVSGGWRLGVGCLLEPPSVPSCVPREGTVPGGRWSPHHIPPFVPGRADTTTMFWPAPVPPPAIKRLHVFLRTRFKKTTKTDYFKLQATTYSSGV